MARKTILLVDAENILHQSFHKFEKLKSTDGKPSGAIFGFFRSLHMYLTRFNPDKVFLTFDNGKSKHRLNLIKDYKAHRQNIAIDYESLQQQKAIIMKMLKYLRIPYIFDKRKHTDYEGDDFLAYLFLKDFSDKTKYKVHIISSDKDFNQLLIHDQVSILNPRKDEVVRRTNCKELFGYEAYNTVDYLAMVGDKSDDIDGIRGIGPKKATDLLAKKLDLTYYFQDENKEILLRNRKMIDLAWFIERYPLDKTDIPMKLVHKTMNYPKFKEICIKYSLASFLTDIFIKPFKQLS